jgi:hypothetical protein
LVIKIYIEYNILIGINMKVYVIIGAAIIYLASTQGLSRIEESPTEPVNGSKTKVSFSSGVEDAIQEQYMETYRQVRDGQIDFWSIAKALQEVLNYRLSQNNFSDKKILEIKNLLRSTERFIKNPSELTETSELAVYQRELFFNRLQKALEEEISTERYPDIMETKYRVTKALSKVLSHI